jgi:hypothetical protein
MTGDLHPTLSIVFLGAGLSPQKGDPMHETTIHAAARTGYGSRAPRARVLIAVAEELHFGRDGRPSAHQPVALRSPSHVSRRNCAAFERSSPRHPDSSRHRAARPRKPDVCDGRRDPPGPQGCEPRAARRLRGSAGNCFDEVLPDCPQVACAGAVTELAEDVRHASALWAAGSRARRHSLFDSPA